MDIAAQGFEDLLRGLSGLVVLVEPVVRQKVLAPVPAALFQVVQVRVVRVALHVAGQRAVRALDVVDDADLGRSALGHDYRHRVVPAQVPNRMDLEQRVVRHRADAAARDRRSDVRRVDRAHSRLAALPLPDVLVVVGAHRAQGVPAFGFELLREPRVIPPVHLDDDRVRRRIRHEAAIALVGLQLRVHRDPDLGALFADRGGQDVPGPLGDRLPLLDPANIDGLEGLEVLSRDARQAREKDLRSVLSPDRALEHVVLAGQAQRLDLIDQELIDRVLQRLLDLARAQDAQRRLGPQDQQRTSDRPGLAGPSPAVSDLVARLLEQALQLGGELGLAGNPLSFRSHPSPRRTRSRGPSRRPSRPAQSRPRCQRPRAPCRSAWCASRRSPSGSATA